MKYSGCKNETCNRSEGGKAFNTGKHKKKL